MKNKTVFLNSLLSLSIGFFTLGVLLDANLHAGKPVYKTPDQLIQGADRGSIQMNPDGSKFIKKNDGTTIRVKPDGTKIIRARDGTTVEVGVDGTKSIKKSNGSTIDIRPGTRYLK